MKKFGVLGNRLVQAAQESNSSLAEMITTQKQSIESEQKLRSYKNSKRISQRKRSGKKRPYRQQEILPQKPASSKTSEPQE